MGIVLSALNMDNSIFFLHLDQAFEGKDSDHHLYSQYEIFEQALHGQLRPHEIQQVKDKIQDTFKNRKIKKTNHSPLHNPSFKQSHLIQLRSNPFIIRQIKPVTHHARSKEEEDTPQEKRQYQFACIMQSLLKLIETNSENKETVYQEVLRNINREALSIATPSRATFTRAPLSTENLLLSLFHASLKSQFLYEEFNALHAYYEIELIIQKSQHTSRPDSPIPLILAEVEKAKLKEIGGSGLKRDSKGSAKHYKEASIQAQAAKLSGLEANIFKHYLSAQLMYVNDLRRETLATQTSNDEAKQILENMLIELGKRSDKDVYQAQREQARTCLNVLRKPTTENKRKTSLPEQLTYFIQQVID